MAAAACASRHPFATVAAYLAIAHGDALDACDERVEDRGHLSRDEVGRHTGRGQVRLGEVK